MLTLAPLPFQIIADKKKNTRGRQGRRGGGAGAGGTAHSAKAKLVGKGGTPAVAAKRRAAAATAATSAPAVASSATTAVKIIVSNLPIDVNEAQIKVSLILFFIFRWPRFLRILMFSFRICSSLL